MSLNYLFAARKHLLPSLLVLLMPMSAIAGEPSPAAKSTPDHAAAQKTTDDAFKSLAPGLEYRHDVRTNGPLSIHVLRMDRQQKWDFADGLRARDGFRPGTPGWESSPAWPRS